MMIEATDINYLKIPTVNISGIESSSSTTANTLSIINIIDDDVAKSVNADIEIDPFHDNNKYHTTVEADVESDEKSDNEENNKKSHKFN
ncbi:hypothetical protein C2G38_2238583 [Gigaspora rosea]|uniref:Uncharacterized protein n=1 Tax=Gigaspora rosea TaxID=44941 RepID=A0A397W5A4_9GLOM|nr:hypothetical protein C2G38_2238583 [Gigaspora rosea]